MGTFPPFVQESDLYRLFFENIPHAVLINKMIYNEKKEDVDFLILDVNYAVEKYTGIKREDIIGRKVKDLQANFEQVLFQIFDEVINSNVPQRFERYYASLSRWFDIYVLPLQIKNCFCLIFRNITEQKLTEEKVSFQAQIIDSVHEPVMATDMDFSISYWNKAAERFYGWNKEEVIGKNADMLLAMSATRKDGVSRLLQNGIEEVETTHLRKDGSEINVETTVSLIYDSNGQPYSTVGVLHDITERKKAEEALRESEKKANMLVVELEKSDKNKNEFISILSHELRNPLAAIAMGLDMLKKKENDKDRYEKVLDMIGRQTEQLTHLIDDILEVTRINQGKIELKKELVNLNILINNVLKDYQAQYETKGIVMETAFCHKPLFLEADPTRLSQIIGNLLHNAVKFTPRGGEVRVTIDRDEEKHQAIISVQDNGEGILPEFLSDLFKPFSQADKTLNRSQGGLGLGLSIVSGMVKLHGGRVEGFSEGLGKGTKFTVRLPIVENEIEDKCSCENTENQLNKSLKILVIEDNKDLAQITCELLVFLGHKAIAVHTGIEGILKSRELKPDVIISDIGLPDISGYEVAVEIRKSAELKDAIMIAMSGYAQPEDINRSKEAGFDRHLGKPVGIDTLRTAIDEFFNLPFQ